MRRDLLQPPCPLRAVGWYCLTLGCFPGCHDPQPLELQLLQGWERSLTPRISPCPPGSPSVTTSPAAVWRGSCCAPPGCTKAPSRILAPAAGSLHPGVIRAPRPASCHRGRSVHPASSFPQVWLGRWQSPALVALITQLCNYPPRCSRRVFSAWQTTDTDNQLRRAVAAARGGLTVLGGTRRRTMSRLWESPPCPWCG